MLARPPCNTMPGIIPLIRFGAAFQCDKEGDDSTKGKKEEDPQNRVLSVPPLRESSEHKNCQEHPGYSEHSNAGPEQCIRGLFVNSPIRSWIESVTAITDFCTRRTDSS